jgi:hypothetical protein
MAVAEQALKTDNASGITGNTTKKGKRDRAVRRRDGGTRARKGGAERLQEAADRRLGRNSERLANLLEVKALEGNLASMKVLVMLAERKKPRPEPVKKPRGPSLAERLAMERPWREVREEGQEQGAGSKE